MSKQTIVVIGSNSFSASYLIRHVMERSSHKIIGISRSPQASPVLTAFSGHQSEEAIFDFHQLSINTQLGDIINLCDENEPEFIFNYAAQGEVRNSWNWPEQWYETNCMGVVKLTTVLKSRSYLKKYVVSSTPEVYGSTGTKISESSKYSPSTPYAASKLAGDLYLEALYKRHDFPVVFTRAANLYGPHQQLYRIIPRTIIFAKLGRTITLHGGGKSRRAFIHASDAANATWKAAMMGGAGEVYHLSPEKNLRTIRSVVEAVLKQMGKPIEESIEVQEENYGQDDCFGLDAQKPNMTSIGPARLLSKTV